LAKDHSARNAKDERPQEPQDAQDMLSLSTLLLAGLKNADLKNAS